MFLGILQSRGLGLLRCSTRYKKFGSTAPRSTKSIYCPACKAKSIRISGDMFCCSICPNQQEVNYFKLLGLPEEYTVDISNAEGRYRDLQMSVHPDKLDTDLGTSIPEGYSSLLNKAITVIKSPLERAMHLLYILDGCTIADTELTNDPELLLTMMELNEEVEDCSRDMACLERLNQANALKLADCDEQLRGLFEGGDFKGARKVCELMHYLERIRNTILEKLNSS